jgi:NAD(P)-dependent dehydrogenase (short-subunit alcohol dehydrogenase family)
MHADDVSTSMPFGAESTGDDVIAGHDLTGRDVIVTGGTSGLGAETARVLASAGARVVLAGRDQTRGSAAAERLRASTGNPTVEFARLDLASLASVRAFVERYLETGRPLRVLIDNAGIMAAPLSYTVDGFESQFGTNHLGHFALTVGLLPALRSAGSARVIVLSSAAHRRSDVDFEDPNYRSRPYDPWQAYGQSKTANALFAVGLTSRHANHGVVANAVMPGAISTDLVRFLSREQLRGLGWTDRDGRLCPPPDWKTVEQGAATTIWAAVASELEGIGGRYLENCAVAKPWNQEGMSPIPPGRALDRGTLAGHYLPYALDPDHAERLWTLSEELTGRSAWSAHPPSSG